jgi:hypothetical protein
LSARNKNLQKMTNYKIRKYKEKIIKIQYVKFF